jgi:flagellar biosynthetic protein FlhB
VSDEKTEEPSPQRLRKAREEGNVAKSKDFSTAVIFGAACWSLSGLIDSAGRQIQGFSKACFALTSQHKQTLDALSLDVAQEGVKLMLTLMLTCVLPLLGLCFVLALATGFAMTGGLFTTQTLMPKLDKMNPAQGLQNIFFSGKTYVELLKNLIKLTVAGILGYKIMSAAFRDILLTSKLPLSGTIELTEELAGRLLKHVGGFLFAIGLFDAWYQHKTWHDGLKMSRQELKDEHKQSEGDPHTKHARKKLAKELLNNKGTKEVAKAKVVVTNPHEIAVALDYEEGRDQAPTVLCKGERLVAQQIIDAAREAGVPIMQNIPLAHSLNQLETGDEIPEELYEAVAEVLNWVYSLAQSEGQA